MTRAPFPLIRHLSAGVTPLLLRLPVTANQVTWASGAAGLACAWMLTKGTWQGDLWAAGWLTVCYLLDNCDGEVARAKNQCSAFGARLDTFIDWLVHAAFFTALGYGVAARTGVDGWIWVGWAGGLGGTVNYVLGLLEKDDPDDDPGGHEGARPVGALQWFTFFLRELSRADFCFIVLALAAVDWLWPLLPGGAVGAQIYWMTRFVAGARRFKV
ncbi:MAG: CDP-alcohol phosphatidyltransferase family protein [Rhodobacterales bacterium]|nr:CDP-alcohol phosphatidyltransferase family protein [Rhodobacterales bacterium]